MTRPLKAAVAATLLALGLALSLPTLAAAADAAPWVGTYSGASVGKDAKGTKGTSGVTVWVEDRGDSTKFTFRFDKFPIIISETATNGGGRQGSMLMGISVAEPGVSGAGLIVVYPRNGNYLMAGKGSGKAVGKQGTGRMGAVRTSTGVQLPSVNQQFDDLFRALLNRKAKATTGKPAGAQGGGAGSAPALGSDDLVSDATGALYAAAEGGGEPAVSQDEADVVIKQAPTVVFVKATTVAPASIIDVAAAKPPATTQTVVTTMIVLLLLTVVAAVVSVGPKLRPSAAVADGPGEPSDDGDGS